MTIKKVLLDNYRNYSSCKIEFNSNCAYIYGENGSGKTNVLEALSLLGPGSGLKNANFADILKMDSNTDCSADICHSIEYDGSNFHPLVDCSQQPRSFYSSWTIFVELQNLFKNSLEFIEKKYEIGVTNSNSSQGKKIKIHGKNATISDLNNIIKILYFVPGMDRVFVDSSAIRRKFLNNLVAIFDNDYVENVLNYEKLVKERMKILQNYYSQDASLADKWLSVIESQLSDFMIKIELSRAIFIQNMNIHTQHDSLVNFPSVKFSLISKILDKEVLNFNVEYTNDFSINRFIDKNSLHYDKSNIISGIKDSIKNHLKSNRKSDFLSKKTNFGCHRSDFSAFAYNIDAAKASTGQQKIVVLSILLSVIKFYTKLTPQKSLIFLLDEVVAHVDDNHKIAFFVEIEKIFYKESGKNLQIIMTGTNKEFLSVINGKVSLDIEFFCVQNGAISKCI